MLIQGQKNVRFQCHLISECQQRDVARLAYRASLLFQDLPQNHDLSWSNLFLKRIFFPYRGFLVRLHWQSRVCQKPRQSPNTPPSQAELVNMPVE